MKKVMTLREWITEIMKAYNRKNAFKLTKLLVQGHKLGYDVLVDGKSAEEIERIINSTDGADVDLINGGEQYDN